MNTTPGGTMRVRTITKTITRLWQDADYAHKRMFEAQTGLRVTDGDRRPRRHLRSFG